MKKTRLMSLLLSMVLLFTNTVVFTTPAMAAEESYALSITNKPGTTFVLSQGEYTSDVCDLWNEIDSDGTGELKFDQSFSININDAVEVYNNFIDTQYPDGDREHYKALEDNNNGAIFYVQARVLINDYEYQFSSKASYMYAPYGLDGEYNEGCGEWNISSYYDDLSEFFTMSKDGGVLNLSLDGTVKEIYEALKAQDEALGDVTINNLEFELRVSCEVEYRGSYGSTNYTELGFDGLSHTLYDKHIYGSTSEYDNLSVVPVTAPLTVNVGPMYEDCYEPVQTEYSWYYEFVKEGYDSDEDETWYGYFEKDENKESDVLTETAPSGTIYGIAYGKVDSDSNSITLDDILNEDNKDFINSFIGEKPRELGGKGQMSIVCTVTLTFEDGKQWVVYITKADYMSRLIIPCMHACTVCGLCTVTDEMLPCNFDQMSYDITNVCICDEPSVPEFSYETVHEEETTIESTDRIVNVVVEKIEVEETPTHSFIINTTEAVGVDNVIGLYNINVFDEEGYPYTLNRYYDEGEELTVSVPVSMEEALALQSGEAALYHILADGTAEEVEGVTVVIDGESATMTFTSDSFSPYIVARTATATTYTVTVTGGTASPAGPYTVDTEVTVTADPDPEGKTFKEWQIEGLSTTTSESRSIFFYMPANNVTITAIYEDANIIIETASATITEPVAGANPDFNIVSADESKYTVTVVKWNLLDGSSYPVLTAGDKFERGESYQLDVKFVANPGYEFSDSCVYNVNGVPRAAYSLTKGERRCYFDVYEIIDTINVKGVVAPVAGATPDVSGITSDTDGINVIDVKWRDKDGYAFEGNPFVAGEKYILWLKYETESGYKVADDAEVTFNISDSNILDKEITHPIIKMTYEIPAASAPTYTVTVNGGTASPAGPNTEGTEVTITATPPANMGFKQWNGLDGVTFVDDTNKQSATATFKMPARAVEATAVYGINNVTATATGNIMPVLGNNAETNPTFTYNFPELETRYNSCWRYSSDGEDFQYAGYVAGTEKFCVGYWRFDLDVDLNGLSICNPCTVTVNGTKWQFVSSVRLMAESPVYYLDAEGNVSVVMFEIDGVTASCPAMPESLSAEDTLPHLAFTPTPSQAVVRGDGTWQKKSGDTWVNVSGAAQAGNTYRYKTLMHIDSSTTTHTFTNDVTLKVNGTSWTVDYTTMQETGTSSVSVMVYSPEYTVAETYTVTFDANSGTGTMTPVTGVSGEYELPACTFTAPSGKKFKAWSVDGVEKAVGDKITVTADTTVTAVWENVSEYTKKGDISAVEATATIDPVLGATTSAVSFTITDPTDAAAKGVIISGTSWYKKDASSIYGWTQCSNGVDTFEEGTYRLSVQLRSKSNDDKEYYAMSDATTFTVNGVQWNSEEPFRDNYATSGYGYRFFVSPEFTLGGKTLDSIAVTTPPTKTAYREGEDFNPAGMVVTATYTDSSTAPVILYTVTDGTDMAAGKTSVTISYTEGGVTETTTQPITVAKEYTVTVNGGTGNGEYIAGEEVSISAFVSTGMQFKEWQGTDGLIFTSGDKNSQTATFTMPAHDVTVTAVTGPAEYYVSVSGGSGTGMYEAGATVTIVADPPEAGKQFKEWSVGDGKVLRFTESDITSSTAKFIMPGEAVRIYATYEDIPATKTPIDTVNISDLAKPVVGEMPNNSITVNGTGVTVDDEGSYWGRFVSPSFSPVYDDDTAVDSVVFREGETYMFQLYLNAAAGYEFTADSKFYFASELLPAPDTTDLSKSFAMVNPSDSTQAVIYINMNDIAHVHVPGDWDFNDTHHWRKCTASGCDAGADVSRLPDYTEHSFVNGLCTCGAHEHNWSADWSVNETHHWHECSANGCTITDNSGKDGYAEHDFTAGACVCGVENVITSIEISGITAPITGETPVNSANVDKVGAEVDGSSTFWVRYDTSTGRTGDTYADGTSVHDTPFRDREIYLLQITINPKTGYSFTADTKLLYGGAELSAPDAANPTASCGAIAPDYSMAMALINVDGTSSPATYTITFDANGGSVTPANAATEATGKLATLPTPTRSGSYTFKGWYTASSGGTKITTDTVFDADTTIYAQWNYTGGSGISVTTYYDVKFNTNGGSNVPAQSIRRNSTANEPNAPTKDGYTFEGWYTDAQCTKAYDFDAKVTKDITLYAKWSENKPIVPDECDGTEYDNCPSVAYGDLDTKAWYHLDVDYALEKGLMNGMGEGIFAPDGKLSRAMLVTILWRLEGKPVVDYLMTFEDVDTENWYTEAVRWAASEGIVLGHSAESFAPNDDITREQLATIIYRYEKYKGGGFTGAWMFRMDYADLDDVSEWSYEAMCWCTMNNIVNGKPGKLLDPLGYATRAEAATMLHRYCEKDK